MLDHLGNGAARRRDHRRSACHRLDHYQAKRLLPLDWKEGCARMLKELYLLAVRDLAQPFDAVAQVRLDELREVLPLLCLAHLAGDLQRQPRLHRDGDRAMRALVGTHAAEEQQVIALLRAEGIDGKVEGVWAVRGPV